VISFKSKMWTKDAWERAESTAARVAINVNEERRSYFERLRDTCKRIVNNRDYWRHLDSSSRDKPFLNDE
jgi:hypothetical protein